MLGTDFSGHKIKKSFVVNDITSSAAIFFPLTVFWKEMYIEKPALCLLAMGIPYSWEQNRGFWDMHTNLNFYITYWVSSVWIQAQPGVQ